VKETETVGDFFCIAAHGIEMGRRAITALARIGVVLGLCYSVDRSSRFIRRLSAAWGSLTQRRRWPLPASSSIPFYVALYSDPYPLGDVKFVLIDVALGIRSGFHPCLGCYAVHPRGNA
jgi:hypothetical protein